MALGCLSALHIVSLTLFFPWRNCKVHRRLQVQTMFSLVQQSRLQLLRAPSSPLGRRQITHKQPGEENKTGKEREADRQRKGETDRWTDKQRERERETDTERQTKREKERETHTHKHTPKKKSQKNCIEIH